MEDQKSIRIERILSYRTEMEQLLDQIRSRLRLSRLKCFPSLKWEYLIC